MPPRPNCHAPDLPSNANRRGILRGTQSAFDSVVRHRSTLLEALSGGLAAGDLLRGMRPGFVFKVEFVGRLKAGNDFALLAQDHALG